MSTLQELESPLIIRISGSDAAKVINNLTTNNVAKMQAGETLESFVTDARGWTVAHGVIHKTETATWLLGQHPNPNAVCNHINRYIVREDAEVSNLAESYSLFVSSLVPEPNDPHRILAVPTRMHGANGQLWVLSAPPKEFAVDGVALANAAELARIRAFWPRMGQDIPEKCIPQELDRDSFAISFTKGCYLGQETIARLDARGQLQRKLCLLKIQGKAKAGDKLLSGEQEVGWLTSSAWDDATQETLALGFLKRGFHAEHCELVCLSSDGMHARATVCASPTAL